MNIMNLVDAVEEERERQGITNKDLCRHAGVGLSTYKSWKDGKVAPNLFLLSCMMDVLNLEVELVKRGRE